MIHRFTLLIFSILLILTGCIGEVKQDPSKKDQTQISSDEQSNPPPESDTNDQEQDPNSDSSSMDMSSEGGPTIDLVPDFSFTGISKIQATSDTRITIWFKPVMVTLGDETYPAVPPQSDSETGKTEILYMYEVVKDEISGSRPPIASFPDAGLELNSNGEFVVSIDIGESGDCGIYNVIARDIKNNTKLNPESYFKVCTFNYYFPDFEGISLVEERQGCARETGAKISWKIATRSEQLSNDISRLNTTKEEKFQQVLTQEISYATYSEFESAINKEINRISAYSPISYYLFWEKNELDLIKRLQSSTAIPNATVTNINTTVFDVNDLNTGTTYYFSIRAATDLIQERNGRVIDQNYKIIKYSTPAEEKVSFDGIAQVEIPSDRFGYSEAIIKFNPCRGCNKYRVWAFENEIPSTFEITNTGELKKELDLDVLGIIDSYKVSGLQPHKIYYFKVAALKMCDGTKIQDSQVGLEGIGKTSPSLAPFNGISTVYSTGSLTSLSMKWELPDTTSGVFDQYQIYMKVNDGPIEEVLNSDIDQVTDLNFPIPRIDNRFPLDNPSLNELTVSNIMAGDNPQNSNQYCFAIGLKESNERGENRIGKSTPIESLKFKCFNFHFVPPIFIGPKIGNCNSSSTSFNIAFDLPSEGTFDEARIYYKEYREPSDLGYLGAEDDFGLLSGGDQIDYSLVEDDTNNVKTNDEGISTKYKNNPWHRIVLNHNPDQSPRLETPGILEDYGLVINDDKPIVPIRNLKPDTWYIFAMELYYKPVGRDPIYIRPSIVEKCKTSKPQIFHSGWAHVLSVGKKTNGLFLDKWIPEKLVFQTEPTDFKDNAKDKEYFIMEDESIDPDTGFKKSPSTDEKNYLTEGIVHLSWFDFRISQSNTYANSLIDGNVGSTISNFYYKVERSTDKNFTESDDLPGQIPLKKGVHLYHATDTKIPIGGKKYYYRVNLWKSGTPLTFSNFDANGSEEKVINAKNKILEVMVPPPNMAFLHQFIINKNQCKKIDLNINHGFDIMSELRHDSTPNTKSSWNYSTLLFDNVDGLNNKLIRADKYLEPPNHNFDITKNYRCRYRGIGAIYDSEEDDYFYDIGKSFLIDRFEIGAKIGVNPDDTTITEKKSFEKCFYKDPNSVDTYYDSVCLTSSKTSLYAKPGTIAYESGGSLLKESSQILSANDPPKNNWVSVVPNADLVSNSAYLPPILESSFENMKVVCQDRTVNISDKSYSGRIPSRQEFLFFSEPYDHLSYYNQLQLFNKIDAVDAPGKSLDSDLNYTCNTSIYNPNNYVPNTSTPKPNYIHPFRELNYLTSDTITNNYPSAHYLNVLSKSQETPHLFKTGSYGEEFSSHLCMSKFGLQDTIGNAPEVTSDFFISTPTGTIYLDIQKTDPAVIDYWKLTPFKLLTDEGSSFLPIDISIHNYYSSEIGFFDGIAPGFSTVQEGLSKTSSFPYWNPISGLAFKDPVNRDTPNLIQIDADTFYEDFESIKTPYIYDNGTNTAVYDEDNFLFGNALQPQDNILLPELANGAPTKLINKSKSLNYLAFYYEFQKSKVYFKNYFNYTTFKQQNSTAPASVTKSTPLITGGGGYSTGKDRNSSYDVNIYPLENYISTYTTVPMDSLAKAGFRCIFPIVDNVE